MPTVVIPERICSHCGGNRWYVRYQKYKDSVYTIHQCSEEKKERDNLWALRNKEKRKLICKKSKDKVKHTDDYKRKNRERAMQWGKLNPERVRENSRKAKLRNPEKYRIFSKNKKQEYRETLSEVYLKDLMCQNSGLSQSDIPQELIELKRKQILLIRELRNHV